MTPLQALAIVDNIFDQEQDERTVLEAWAYLIKTRMAWELPGHYGRISAMLIEQGVITPHGKLNEISLQERNN